MNPFEVATVVMDAVEVHATRGCEASIVRFQHVLESKDDGFEAAWIVAERLASHAEASGHGGVAFAVPMPAPPLVIESALLIARLVESSSKQDRDAARRACGNPAGRSIRAVLIERKAAGEQGYEHVDPLKATDGPCGFPARHGATS